MGKLTRIAVLATCLLLYGTAWLGPGSPAVLSQEGGAGARQVTHNAPESITGKLQGNKAHLLSGWRLLSNLAVRFLSGNEAELLSGNAPELLSHNAPNLMSGNETRLLSGNDPQLLSGNDVVLFSHNTLQIHVTESSLKSIVEARRRREAAVESRAKAVRAKHDAQAEALADELSVLRAQMQQLEAQNSALEALITELSTDTE